MPSHSLVSADLQSPMANTGASIWPDLVAAARIDFGSFVELMFPVLHPGEKLDHAPYLDLIEWLLMRVGEGRYKSLILNLPPRHMKSVLASVLYPAWRLGRDPGCKFICVSYSDDLGHDLSARTRKIMLSPAYQLIFPKTRLGKIALGYIATTAGGYRYVSAVGSHVTGFGADEIIIDDPMQPEEAASETAKKRLNDWIGSSLFTRFNNPDIGRWILVMHRLAPDDLSARLERGAEYTLALPLVAEETEKYEYEGKRIFHREPGDILNPKRFDQKSVDRLKAQTPRHVFAAQYQQQPTVGGSGMLSVDKWRRYDPADKPQFELIIHSWDIGATISGNASVCTAWGLAKNSAGLDCVYLLDVQRLNLELPEVRSAIRVADQRDRPALIIIDENGVGLGLYQELQREGYRNIERSSATAEPVEYVGTVGRRPNLSKIERFGKAVLQIANGRALLPTSAPWLESFLYEVTSFPNIADNDQVDSMTQLVGNLDRAFKLARKYLARNR